MTAKPRAAGKQSGNTGSGNLKNGPGKGRPAGALNKTTRTLKGAIEKAFAEVGGAAWLVELAKSDPRSFVALLGRLLPSEVKAEVNTKGELKIIVNVKGPE